MNFILTGIGAWLVIMAICVVFIVATEINSWFTATLAAAVGVLLLHFFTAYSPIDYVLAHPLNALLIMAAYVVIGIIWSMGKWALEVLKQKEIYKQWLTSIMAVNPDRTAEQLRTKYHVVYPPVAADNKSRILIWMGLWPFSFFWTMLNDPLRRFFNGLYNIIGGYYQKISDKIAST